MVSAKRIVLLASAAAMTAFTVFSPASAQDRVRWKLHSAWSSSVPHLGTSGVRYSENIGRLTGGAFQMKFFEPGALVPANEGFDATSKGSIDAAWTTAGYDVGKVPAQQPEPVRQGWVAGDLGGDPGKARAQCGRPLGWGFRLDQLDPGVGLERRRRRGDAA